MREIKLRVFDNGTKTMHVCGSDAHDSIGFNDGNLTYYNYQNGESSLKDDDGNSTYVLMQYTGLKDKNGKEIYEGDIYTHNVQDYVAGYPRETNFIKPVIFEMGVFWVGDMPLIDAINNDMESEVIGNIYENPELMEGNNVKHITKNKETCDCNKVIFKNGEITLIHTCKE